MIKIEYISKKYKKGLSIFTALEDINFEIEKGDFCSVIGPSGAGKSTLLHALGGLIQPDKGTILYNERNLYDKSKKDLALYRKKYVGFMFQQFHLMPYLSVIDNIKLARYEKKHFDNISHYLQKCSLADIKNKYPSELSVGEKQRTAFIRAIISNPELLLADEPTGNLDPGNGSILMSLIEEYHKNKGTVVIVSHDPIIAKYANRKVVLEKGRMISAF
jgi:putative ABC transport system ATP-binding protein